MEKEYMTYPVKIKVVSQKGWCGTCHKVGDEWIYAIEPGRPPKTPDICPAALASMYKNIWIFWVGGILPWPTPDPDTCNVACPDAANPVVFELKRLRDQPFRYCVDSPEYRTSY